MRDGGSIALREAAVHSIMCHVCIAAALSSSAAEIVVVARWWCCNSPVPVVYVTITTGLLHPICTLT
jgi:hypothetical protein